MPPEYDEQHRRELIRELEEKKRRIQAEVKDFEAVAAQKGLDLEAQLRRLHSEPPPGDICPECWFTHGKTIAMLNHPEQPVQPMRDRFVCPNCLREELRCA